MVEHGTAHLYQLNREHVAAEAIILLAQLRERLLQRIRENVATWNPAPEAVWLFGSFARGEGDEASDIDLLIIRPTELAETDGDVYSVWEQQMLDLIECVITWSGNDCRIVEYTRDEYEALLQSGERLPRDIARDGIRLAGRKVPRPSGVKEE